MIDWLNSNNEWIKIGLSGFLLTIIVALVGGLFKFCKWLVHQHFRHMASPRLRLEIGNSDDCLPYSEKDWKNNEGTISRKFVKLKLFNDAPSDAENVQIRIVRLRRLDAGREVAIGYEVAHPLWWERGGSSADHSAPRTVPHGGPFYADLLFARLKNGCVEYVLQDLPYTQVPLASERTYRVIVQATAKNAKAATLRFDVKLGLSEKEIEIQNVRKISERRV